MIPEIGEAANEVDENYVARVSQEAGKNQH
jgi:hypothetical protein